MGYVETPATGRPATAAAREETGTSSASPRPSGAHGVRSFLIVAALLESAWVGAIVYALYRVLSR